jgi:DNA-binding GntR family transcriptional regulator
LIRARRVVEGEIAALAAQQAKRRDIDAMRAAIDTMTEDADRNVMPLLTATAPFTLAIVPGLQQQVLSETVQTFWDARRGPLFERLGGLFRIRAFLALGHCRTRGHDCCHTARDATAARAAMHQHMDRSHARFSASWRRANHP